MKTVLDAMDTLADHIDSIQARYDRHLDALMHQTTRTIQCIKTIPVFYALCYLDKKIIGNSRKTTP